MNAPLAQPPVRETEVVTFGCRLNAYESEVMKGHARAAGLTDAVILNSCAVTAEAERQLRQAIRRTRRERPGAQIIVTGCAAQISPETYAAMPEVDRVVGNREKLEPGAWLPHGQPRVAVNDIMAVEETASHLIQGFEEKTRAFVQVQQGCDHRCTFCIIPYGRGNSRSVPIGAVVDQVRTLAENGVQEVVLTGVDITSYGGDLPGHPRLGDLVARILTHVPGLARLRLSSIDSIEVDPALMDVIASERRLMPHLHLSLQAGDDMVLRNIGLRYFFDGTDEAMRDVGEVVREYAGAWRAMVDQAEELPPERAAALAARDALVRRVAADNSPDNANRERVFGAAMFARTKALLCGELDGAP